MQDSDFAAILGRASGLLFLSSNDADYFGKKVRSDEFRDCTHILGLFCFSPRSVSLRGDERPYRPSRASCRAGSDADAVAVIKLAHSVERSRVTCPLPDIELASPARKAQRHKISDGLQEAVIDSFVSRENIRRYRKLASESTDATERSRTMKLLAEEETKFKLELRRGGDPPEERSPVNTATEDRVEHDGDEQQGAG